MKRSHQPEHRRDQLRVAVTGGSGQFGMAVLRRLAEDPVVRSLVSLDVAPPRLVGPKIESVQADVRDPEIGRHFEGCDAVIHLAFSVHRYRPRKLFDAVNVEGSKNVFRAARDAGVEQIIYASSVAAYGLVHGHPLPIREDDERFYQPEFAYSRAKYEVEAFLDDFERENPEMIITRLRPVVTVGERMESLMGWTLRNRRIPTTGNVPFPVVWEEDVVDAVDLALRHGAAGAFNLSADGELTAKELAREVGMKTVKIPRWLGLLVAHLSPYLAKLGIGSMIDPAWIRSSDAPIVLSSEKAVRELGWQRRCPTTVDVMRHFDRVVPRHLDNRIVAWAKSLHHSPAPADAPADAPAVHLHLTGPPGGDLTLGKEDGHWIAHKGRPWLLAASIHLHAQTLLDLLAGVRDWATAASSGEIRIEGPEEAVSLVRRALATPVRAGT